jgi:geranylgeranyl transferase type-1 subunit beta
MAPGLARDADASTLNYAAHIRYWRRNLKTFLPHHYTGNDCNRMTLAAFILSALDILGDLPAALAPEERAGYVDWVYRCQLPGGGFRPAPATDLGPSRNHENQIWDPSHVAGTFFALLILVNLGDDLQRVRRREILQWLTKLQRPDGGFGETLGEHDRVEGGNDPRFGFMVTAVRWMLRGNLEGPVDGVPDIDVDAFVRCVQVAETYDGGLSEAPYHEAHGGFTSCAISALYFLDRLPAKKPDGRQRGLRNLPMTLHWLASRQTLDIDEEDAADAYSDETDPAATCHDPRSSMELHNYPSMRGNLSFESQPPVHAEPKWVGMNGRENKIGDTCYAYWVCAPLRLLGRLDIIDPKPIRRWLLDRTQHLIGGFGKLPGDHPDPQHSFLGLMVLSMFGEPGLQNVDTALCITERAKNHLESLPWRRELLGLHSTDEV